MVDFVSTFNKHNGIFHANKFDVDFSGLTKLGIVDAAGARELSSYVKTVNLPGRQFATSAYTAWRNSIAVPAGYANEDVSMEIIVPGDFFTRKVFDKWLNLVVNEETYKSKYWNDFTADLRVKCYDRANKITYNLEIQQCYPKASNGISLNTAAAADVSTITIEFAYNSLKLAKA